MTLPTFDANAWQDYFYVGASNAETRAGISLPNIAAYQDDATSLVWDYYGSTMSGGIMWPAWVPTNYPTSATADTLVTTIASGAGTTTLTTADTVGTNVTGATIRFDNAPNLKAAYTAAAATGGEVFLPPISTSSNYYATNSFLSVTGPTLQAGAVYLGDTLQYSGSWFGDGILNATQSASPAIRARRARSYLYGGSQSRHLPDRRQLSRRFHQHQRECLYRDVEHLRATPMYSRISASHSAVLMIIWASSTTASTRKSRVDSEKAGRMLRSTWDRQRMVLRPRHSTSSRIMPN